MRESFAEWSNQSLSGLNHSPLLCPRASSPNNEFDRICDVFKPFERQPKETLPPKQTSEVSLESSILDAKNRLEAKITACYTKVISTNPETMRRKQTLTCMLCGLQSARLHNMKDHIRSHLSERPFKCQICGVGFS